MSKKQFKAESKRLLDLMTVSYTHLDVYKRQELCRFGAISRAAGGVCAVDELACEGCGLCVECCPAGAARLEPDVAGRLLVHSGGGAFAEAELRICLLYTSRCV